MLAGSMVTPSVADAIGRERGECFGNSARKAGELEFEMEQPAWRGLALRCG